MILEFILTNLRKVQDRETEQRELAVLTESQAIDIAALPFIPKGLQPFAEGFFLKSLSQIWRQQEQNPQI